MPKVEQDAPLEQNYESLNEALEDALEKASLAVEQLKVAKSTLQAGFASLAEIGSSEEARAECEMNFMVSQVVSTRAVSNLWSAAGTMSEAFGLDDEEPEDDEEDDE